MMLTYFARIGFTFLGGCEFSFFIKGEGFNEPWFLRKPGADNGVEPSLLSPPSSQPGQATGRQPSRPLSVHRSGRLL